MKPILSIIQATLFSLCCCMAALPLRGAEHTAYVDDIVYVLDIEHRTAEVGVNPKAYGDIVLPEQITDGEGRTYTVTSLGAEAFKGCKALSSIVLPATIRQLYRSSLEGTGVYLNRELWQDGALYIDSCLIAVDKTVSKPKFVVAEGTRVIAGGSFQGNKVVTSVVIPSSVSRIDVFTFKDCKSLQKVRFGQHITSIGRDAFMGSGIYLNEKKWKKGILYVDSCLIAVNKEVPAKVQYKTPYYLIAEGAFAENTVVQSVELSPLLTSVPAACFYGCTSLRTVQIPEGVTDIGAFAFYKCALLQELKLPAGVKHLGAGTFYECSALPAIRLPQGIDSIPTACFYGCRQFKEFAFPERLTYIGAGAFAGCIKLEQINLPATLREIGRQCFIGCATLERVVIPELVPAVPEEAFAECNHIYRVTLPDNLYAIDNGAFRNCVRLERIVLPDRTFAIGKQAFAGCTALEQVDMGEDLHVIDDEAFRGCRFIREMDLSKRVEYIGARAFAGCKQLKKVTLPTKLEVLGAEAFMDCDKLPSLLPLLPTDCKVGKYAFKGCKE